MPASRAMSIISRAVASVVAIGFCTCTGLPARGAGADGIEPERRKRADVHEIDLGMPADVFVPLDELRAVRGGERAPLVLRDIGAGANRVADVLVRARVHAGDRAGADDADAETHSLVVAGPHPHDLYLATFGRSTVVVTLICLVRQSSLDLRQFFRRPRAFAIRRRCAHLLDRSGIDRRSGLSPRASDVREDRGDLGVVQRVAMRRHQADRALFAVQQHANRHARRPDDARRAGDVRRRARLLAAVGAVASLADVLVDFLPGREALLIRGVQRCSGGRNAWLSRATRFAPSLSRRDRQARPFPRRRLSARAHATASRTARPHAPAAQEAWRLRAHLEMRVRRRVRRDRPDTFRTAHSDHRHLGSACRASSRRAARLRRRASSADRCHGARDVSATRASSVWIGASSPTRTIVAASIVIAADRCGVSPAP